MELDWSKLTGIHGVEEIHQVVAVFKVYVGGAPSDFRIEVSRSGSGKFTGVCNYAYWGPDQGAEYLSLHPNATIEEAVADAMTGVTAFRSDTVDPAIEFWVKRTPEGEIILDGNGKRVSREEANARRAGIKK